MEPLLDFYIKNVGKRPLFEDIMAIDFYDGPTEALCKVIDGEQWVICSLVYIDFKKRERIYTVLEIDRDLLLKLKSNLEHRLPDQEDNYARLKAQVKDVYNHYSGKIFLFKSDWLNSVDYKVVEISLMHLLYFVDIEQVLEQSEELKLKWTGFFSSK
jgi:hypothetical protein